MKQAHVAYRHSGNRVYATDVYASDGRKVASVPMSEEMDQNGEVELDPIAARLLDAQQLLEKFPPFKGTKK